MKEIIRLRRNRQNEALRNLVAEVQVSVDDIICPIFVTSRNTEKIPSMPGILRWNLDELAPHIDSLLENGVKAFLLFGIPNKKDETGSEAWSPEGIVQKALRNLRTSFPEILLFSDVCLCQYTTHGHCGILTDDGIIDNDPTLQLLANVAESHAEAGAHYVAPSDMMDHRVHAIRDRLDEEGHSQVGIMSYSAKYQSAFYGPFRDAADSSPKTGDRSSYQMDFRNRREAIREIELDLVEGADIVMVKPALAYLDIIRDVRRRFKAPIAAYNVSGEFSMVKAAAMKGWIDETRTALEILTAIKRAGADLIITYFAETIGEIIP